MPMFAKRKGHASSFDEARASNIQGELPISPVRCYYDRSEDDRSNEATFVEVYARRRNTECEASTQLKKIAL